PLGSNQQIYRRRQGLAGRTIELMFVSRLQLQQTEAYIARDTDHRYPDAFGQLILSQRCARTAVDARGFADGVDIRPQLPCELLADDHHGRPVLIGGQKTTSLHDWYSRRAKELGFDDTVIRSKDSPSSLPQVSCGANPVPGAGEILSQAGGCDARQTTDALEHSIRQSALLRRRDTTSS